MIDFLIFCLLWNTKSSDGLVSLHLVSDEPGVTLYASQSNHVTAESLIAECFNPFGRLISRNL